MKTEKVNIFGKIGKLIIKRKFTVIFAWLLLLVLILPFALNTTGVISLQMGSADDDSLESVKADNLISQYFSSSVANNSLVIVVSTNNASSIETQHFLEQLTEQIKQDPEISGIQNVTNVYTFLIPALNQTNEGAYTVYTNANMTYNMLYGVPVMYKSVWEAAYEQTQTELAGGLEQLNPSVYMVFDNANMTYNMLYSVPAMYLNIWSQTYNQTQSIPMANDIAYNQTATMLYQLDPASFEQYTSQLLYAFNASWTMSFQKPATQNLQPIQRASVVTDQTVQMYISNFLAGNQTAQDFTSGLTSTLKLEDFLFNTPEQNSAALQEFSVSYIANQSSETTREFVNAAFNLGRKPSQSAINALTKDIIWSSHTYGMDDFISMFNEISYDQSVSILKDADQEAFDQYTSHLLDIFDASWTKTFDNSSMNQYTPTERALVVSEQTTPEFVDQYLNDNSTIHGFATALTTTFTIDDFLNNDEEQNNAKLYNFTITYLSDQSNIPEDLIATIYNLGENPSEAQLRELAGNIVWNPEAYNIGQEFNTLVSSFVSPSKDVTIISVDLNQSSDSNIIAMRETIQTALSENPTIESALVTGTDALNYDFNVSTYADLELILPVTLVLLLVATGLFFRSIVTPLITLGSIGIGLGISQIFLYLVGTYINQVDFMIPTILLTVLIGVGTDYSIFVIARHREERVNGLPLHQAIIRSVTWAGESITTSGATVIISFLSLAITSIVLMQTMGLVVGLGVIVVLLVSLTFVPAITAVLGDRIFWPNTGERFQKYANAAKQKTFNKNGYFAKSGNFSVKHAKVIVLIAVLVTVPTLYVYATNTPTYDFLGGASKNLDSIQASHTLTESFGGGKLFPSYVVVTFDQPFVQDGVFNNTQMAAIQAISSQIANHADVQEVSSPTMPYNVPIYCQNITSTSDEATYNSIMTNIGSDNKSALITLRFSLDPYSTPAMNAAQDLRTSLHENFDNTNGITNIYLGGTTGAILDTKNVFVEQFNVILPIVAVGVSLVLFFVLGSLFLPLFALVSVLMSIVWTLAITAVLFESAFSYGLLFMTPLILFVLLLGLGMDYNIFILTRIREEAAKGEKLNTAIVHSIEQTGGIITAAAIILAGSLGALMLSSNILLREMGFAFAFSILIDALVVRTYLVPAVMSMLGKWNWYNPIKRLQRIKTDDDNKKTKQ